VDKVAHRIVYLSPTGSTRRVAQAIGKALQASGCDATALDLGGEDRGAEPGEWLRGVTGPVCLWVGSPVYAHHPIPQVSAFVAGLPVFRQGFAVPFVTWGSICSGMALWDLGAGLAARGYGLLGAVSVPAVHCTFWKSSDPPGAGRPNATDLTQVEEMVRTVLAKLPAGGPLVAPETLDHQPPRVRVHSEAASLQQAKTRMPPRRALEDRCTQCGDCVAACPVGAVTLAPYPVFDATCVLCNGCVRACPEDAIPFDAEATMARIRGLAVQFGEDTAIRSFS